jgi:hypothetical protein
MREKSVLLYLTVQADSSGGTQYEPHSVKLDSPRFKAALNESGIDLEQLGEQPKFGPFGWSGLGRDHIKAGLRAESWDKMRERDLGLVMGIRGRMVADEMIRYQKALKAAEGGGFGQASIAEQLAEQRSTMIAQAEASRAATAEAAQRRIAQAQKRLLHERALAEARTTEERRVQAELEAAREVQRAQATKQRKERAAAAVIREREKVRTDHPCVFSIAAVPAHVCKEHKIWAAAKCGGWQAERYEREQLLRESKLVRFEEADEVSLHRVHPQRARSTGTCRIQTRLRL